MRIRFGNTTYNISGFVDSTAQRAIAFLGSLVYFSPTGAAVYRFDLSEPGFPQWQEERTYAEHPLLYVLYREHALELKCTSFPLTWPARLGNPLDSMERFARQEIMEIIAEILSTGWASVLRSRGIDPSIYTQEKLLEHLRFEALQPASDARKRVNAAARGAIGALVVDLRSDAVPNGLKAEDTDLTRDPWDDPLPEQEASDEAAVEYSELELAVMAKLSDQIVQWFLNGSKG
jgi:hypothetical protein